MLDYSCLGGDRKRCSCGRGVDSGTNCCAVTALGTRLRVVVTGLWSRHVCDLQPGNLGLSKARCIRYKVPAHVVRLCRRDLTCSV